MTRLRDLGRPLHVTAALLLVASVLAALAIADGGAPGAAVPVAQDRLVFTAISGASMDLAVQTLGGAPVPLTAASAWRRGATSPPPPAMRRWG